MNTGIDCSIGLFLYFDNITGGRARQQVESQMVQMGKMLDAIMLNVYAHQWDRYFFYK